MQCQANRIAGIEDRLFAANMQSSSDTNGPKMKNWAGVWGIFLPWGSSMDSQPWRTIAWHSNPVLHCRCGRTYGCGARQRGTPHE